jgi:hypothetical protein
LLAGIPIVALTAFHEVIRHTDAALLRCTVRETLTRQTACLEIRVGDPAALLRSRRGELLAGVPVATLTAFHEGVRHS